MSPCLRPSPSFYVSLSVFLCGPLFLSSSWTLGLSLCLLMASLLFENHKQRCPCVPSVPCGEVRLRPPHSRWRQPGTLRKEPTPQPALHVHTHLSAILLEGRCTWHAGLQEVTVLNPRAIAALRVEEHPGLSLPLRSYSWEIPKHQVWVSPDQMQTVLDK